MGEIVHLPTTDLTPEALMSVVCNEGDVKGMVIVTMDHDGSMKTWWTRMTLAELCLASMVLEGDVSDETRAE